MGIQYADIIFFAIVAVYLGLKLYTTLGKRDRDDDVVSRFNGAAPAEAERLTKKPAIEKVESLEKKEVLVIAPKIEFINKSVEDAIDAISARDLNFSVGNFLYGSKLAFEMVVEGYAKKDKATLKNLLSNSVFINFSNAIDDMAIKGHEQTTNIVSIAKETITEASLTGNIARIKVSFVSEQISVTKDESGNVIDGNPTNIFEVEDEWEFEKDLTDSSPNWEVVAV